jgi:hypothetical protein
MIFREVARVDGGVFLFKTPNKTHSIPTIARLTRHRFHPFVNRIRGQAEADTFPTCCQANTYFDVQCLAAASSLRVERLDRIAGRPEDLRLTWPTDRLGAAYERRVNVWDGLAMFRVLRVREPRKG